MTVQIKHWQTGSVLAIGETTKVAAEVSKGKLVGANLGRANLVGADLVRADLGGADLRRADLRRADLGRADLGRADLRWADLRGADLRGADLGWADLRRADLGRANLRGADLRGADLGWADLGQIIPNWQSHWLLAEFLRRGAGDSVARRKVAGLVLISHDWCWDEFMAIAEPEREWALRTLAAHVADGDGHPAILDAYRAVAVEEAD